MLNRIHTAESKKKFHPLLSECTKDAREGLKTERSYHADAMFLAPEPIVFRIGPTMGLEYFSAAALSIASCIFCHTRGTPKKRVGRTLRASV